MAAIFGIAVTTWQSTLNVSIPKKYRQWFPVDPQHESPPLSKMAKLQAATPDITRLETWMEDPQTRKALRLLSKTPVSLTALDAEILDSMVQTNQHRKEQAKKVQDAQLWAAGLRELREEA